MPRRKLLRWVVTCEDEFGRAQRVHPDSPRFKEIVERPGGTTADLIREDLIAHHGYNPRITVSPTLTAH